MSTDEAALEAIRALAQAIAPLVAAELASTSDRAEVVPVQPRDPDRLLAVADLATEWGCSVDCVYDLIRAGELPVVQIGRGDRNKYRIRHRDADDYIDRNTTTRRRRR